MVKHSFLLIFIIIPFLLGAEAIPTEGSTVIAWEAPPATYRVEIQYKNQVFLDIETEKTEIRPDLAPGIYQYRISVLSPFGKPVSTSGWQKLEVIPATPPFFRVSQYAKGQVGTPSISLSITGKNLTEDITYQLVRNNEKIPIAGIKQDDHVLFQIDTSRFSLGTWDLLASSPTGKQFLSPEVLHIFAEYATTTDENWLLSTDGLVFIDVDSNIDPELSITIQGPKGDVPITRIEKLNAGITRLSINMNTSESGNHIVFLTDQSGNIRWKKNFIVVSDIKDVSLNDNVQLSLQVALAPMLLTSTASYINIYSIETAVDFYSQWEKPFWRALGIELHGNMGFTLQNNFETSSIAGMFDIAAFWRPWLKSKITPILQVGAGNLSLSIISETNERNSPFVRFTIGADMGTTGNHIRFTASTIFTIGNNSYLPIIALSLGRGMGL